MQMLDLGDVFCCIRKEITGMAKSEKYVFSTYQQKYELKNSAQHYFPTKLYILIDFLLHYISFSLQCIR